MAADPVDRRSTGPTIRVLLREGFDRVTVRHSHLAPEVVVLARGDRFQIRNTSGTREVAGVRLEPEPNRLLEVDGAEYRGSLDIFRTPGGKTSLVNEVPIESYLKSVVPHELGPVAFPYLEALKAQAVAARTYAVVSLGTYAGRGFDVFADARSQVYEGTRREHPLSNEAVERTAGQILTYDDKPIWALYSSTCGGETESFENIFRGDRIPYLAGGAACHDERSPFHQWVQTVDAERIENSLRRWGDVGNLRDLNPRRYSAAGRLIEMEFQGDRGEVTLKGSDVRSVLGVRSNFIVDLQIEREGRDHVKRIRVEGKGWGHGVGMCQIGAVDLAERGKDYREILKHYYRGVDIVKRY